MKTPYRDWPIMDIVNRIRREWDNEQAAEQVLGLYEEANSWHKTSENLSRGCAELQSKLEDAEKRIDNLCGSLESSGKGHAAKDAYARELESRLDTLMNTSKAVYEIEDLKHDIERHIAALTAETNARIEAERRLDASESMLAIWRDAEAKRREGDRYEIRLNDDGTLDEIVGSGLIHLEQMNTNEWFLELAGCALWISGKKVTMRARDHESWADAQRASLVERQSTK